jgi:hypothetical protein
MTFLLVFSRSGDTWQMRLSSPLSRGSLLRVALESILAPLHRARSSLGTPSNRVTAPVSHQKRPSQNPMNAIESKRNCNKINEAVRYSAAHNCLVAGSSPAGPTSGSMAYRIFILPAMALAMVSPPIVDSATLSQEKGQTAASRHERSFHNHACRDSRRRTEYQQHRPATARKLAHCRSTRGFNHYLAGATFGISRKRKGFDWKTFAGLGRKSYGNQ